MQIFICQHCGKEHSIIATGDTPENTADKIIVIGVNYFHIPLKTLQNKNRGKQNVYARQFIMFLLRRYTNDGSKSIGRLFNRDHSTVLYAQEHIQGFLDINDPQVCRDYEAIKKYIN